MDEPTNRLQRQLQFLDYLPRDVQAREREFAFFNAFSSFYTNDELKKKRRWFRTTRKIQRSGEKYCTRMVLLIEGILALRELGLATYTKPAGRKRKKQ